MLRMEIMALLSEVGSEQNGNPIQIQENENGDNLAKNSPMKFIFGPKLNINERNIF